MLTLYMIQFRGSVFSFEVRWRSDKKKSYVHLKTIILIAKNDIYAIYEKSSFPSADERLGINIGGEQRLIASF